MSNVPNLMNPVEPWRRYKILPEFLGANTAEEQEILNRFNSEGGCICWSLGNFLDVRTTYRNLCRCAGRNHPFINITKSSFDFIKIVPSYMFLTKTDPPYPETHWLQVCPTIIQPINIFSYSDLISDLRRKHVVSGH